MSSHSVSSESEDEVTVKEELEESFIILIRIFIIKLTRVNFVAQES